MLVLIGYASAHGSTRGVAERVAARLGERRFAAEVRSLVQVEDAENAGAYDAFVIGSAIYDGLWLPEAVEFIRGHLGVLADRPVWLFSVSLLGDQRSAFGPAVASRRRALTQRKEMASFLKATERDIHPRDHHAFAGAIDPSHWLLSGRVIFNGTGGCPGDDRNWEEIDAWAEGLVRELQSVPSPAAGCR